MKCRIKGAVKKLKVPKILINQAKANIKTVVKVKKMSFTTVLLFY